MVKGDGRIQSQETTSRLSRFSATGSLMDTDPKRCLIVGTALANERDERISTMLPDRLNTFLDTLDTIFAPNKQPFTPWHVVMDVWKEGTRANGTSFEYKSAMGKRAKFDDCRTGLSEVDKSLNNPTTLSQSTPQTPDDWRLPSEGASVADSSLDADHLIRISAIIGRRTRTAYPLLYCPTTAN